MAARLIVLWTAMLLYGAAIVSCIAAFLWAWRKRLPFTGPASAAYLSPLTNILFGAGFLVSALANNTSWLRAMFVAVGLLQFLVAWKLRKRLRQSGANPPVVASD
jgi:hypothetical protein